jgi:hypothetical protein
MYNGSTCVPAELSQITYIVGLGRPRLRWSLESQTPERKTGGTVCSLLVVHRGHYRKLSTANKTNKGLTYVGNPSLFRVVFSLVLCFSKLGWCASASQGAWCMRVHAVAWKRFLFFRVHNTRPATSAWGGGARQTPGALGVRGYGHQLVSVI